MKDSIVFLKNENDGSSYYRLYQYLNNCRIINMTPSRVYKFYYNLKKSGRFMRILMGVITLANVMIAMLIDSLIWRSQTIIINRRFFPRSCPKLIAYFLERYLKNKKVYWDFDDNIISDGEISIREAGILEKYAKSIIVTNEHLAKTISSQYRHKVRFLPTTDCEFETCNIDEIINEKKAEIAKEVRLCWVGTRDNLKYLYEIIPVLDETAKYCNENFKKKVLLKVVANKDLEAEYKNLIIENIHWSRKRAARIIKESHIGLMPLRDSDYNRGKGGFKAIQYMSAATLPLVSKVGYNVNVLSDGESGFFCNKSSDWKEKIIFISENTDIWERISREARKSWENKFSPKKVREYWNKVMEGNI